MPGFQVGDRVVWPVDGTEGTVISRHDFISRHDSFGVTRIRVKWDDGQVNMYEAWKNILEPTTTTRIRLLQEHADAKITFRRPSGVDQ